VSGVWPEVTPGAWRESRDFQRKAVVGGGIELPFGKTIPGRDFDGDRFFLPSCFPYSLIRKAGRQEGRKAGRQEGRKAGIVWLGNGLNADQIRKNYFLALFPEDSRRDCLT
jgi:hypothetical protein